MGPGRAGAGEDDTAARSRHRGTFGRAAVSSPCRGDGASAWAVPGGTTRRGALGRPGGGSGRGGPPAEGLPYRGAFLAQRCERSHRGVRNAPRCTATPPGPGRTAPRHVRDTAARSDVPRCRHRAAVRCGAAPGGAGAGAVQRRPAPRGAVRWPAGPGRTSGGRPAARCLPCTAVRTFPSRCTEGVAVHGLGERKASQCTTAVHGRHRSARPPRRELPGPSRAAKSGRPAGRPAAAYSATAVSRPARGAARRLSVVMA